MEHDVRDGVNRQRPESLQTNSAAIGETNLAAVARPRAAAAGRSSSSRRRWRLEAEGLGGDWC
jgi:hypothetical protein